ncbi:MAG: DUF192 domain-containing protein [Paracoccaceae bacterium]|nr:DUF192 domain-containing protein [Paracoccaceae bacterium]
MGNGLARGALSALLWVGFGLHDAQAAACRADLALFSLPRGGEARFTVEVADTPAERAQGLMARKSLPASAGMLFVYDSEREVAFWMKNTLIPLDMIFIDATGAVVAVHENAVPLDETPIPSGAPVQIVLEIRGGLARKIGLVPGAHLAHPAIDPARALLPCD